ncbi:MAG TPA: hypothetical protein VLK58_26430 [Conexibacter sp.]|nr:hypothetical protein [Conexibacter sp.]
MPSPARVPTNSGIVGAPLGGKPVDVNAGYTGSTYTGGSTYSGGSSYGGGTATGYTPGVSARGSAGTTMGLSIPSYRYRKTPSQLAAARFLQGLLTPSRAIPSFSSEELDAWREPEKKRFGFNIGPVRIEAPGPVQNAAEVLSRVDPGALASGTANVAKTGYGAAKSTVQFGLRSQFGTDKLLELPQGYVKQKLIRLVPQFSIPGLADLNRQYNNATRGEDPLNTRGFFETTGKLGMGVGIGRRVGLPGLSRVAGDVAILDKLNLMGGAWLNSSAAWELVMGRGSVQDYADATVSSGLAFGAAALPMGKFRHFDGRALGEMLGDLGLAKDVADFVLENRGRRSLEELVSPTDPRHWLPPSGPIRIRAGGGVVANGETTLVGERGPEIVQLPAGSNVIPAHRSRELMEPAPAGGRTFGGDRELHVHQHLDGREIARSTVRNLDDDEQWGWR